jgi:hypothetical protein
LIKAGNRQELIAALTKAIDINDALLDHKKELCRNKIENHFLWEKIIDENIEKITAALVAAS